MDAEFTAKRIAFMQKTPIKDAISSLEKDNATYLLVSELQNLISDRIGNSAALIHKFSGKYDYKNSYDGDEADEYFNACETVEDSLGLSFVACQFLITETEGACLAIHDLIGAKGRKAIGHNGSRKSIMSRGNDKAKETNRRRIEAIDAAADYYKHRASWKENWQTLKGSDSASDGSNYDRFWTRLLKWFSCENTRRRTTVPPQTKTVLTIEELGATTESFPENMRILFRAITGTDDFGNLSCLIEILQSWRDKLRADYQQALIKAKKL